MGYFIFARETGDSTKTDEEHFTVCKAHGFGSDPMGGTDPEGHFAGRAIPVVEEEIRLELSGHGGWFSRMRNRWFHIHKSMDFLTFLRDDETPGALSQIDKKMISRHIEIATGEPKCPECGGSGKVE